MWRYGGFGNDLVIELFLAETEDEQMKDRSGRWRAEGSEVEKRGRTKAWSRRRGRVRQGLPHYATYLYHYATVRTTNELIFFYVDHVTYVNMLHLNKFFLPFAFSFFTCYLEPKLARELTR